MAANVIRFSVPGIPKPAGSKSGFPYVDKQTGKTRVRIVDACKGSQAWKKTVARYARKGYLGKPVGVPCKLRLWFYMPRPKSHYRQGKFAHLLKPSAPNWHTFKPDVLKLARAVEDALTGIIYTDDSNIVSESMMKFWTENKWVGIGSNGGVEIQVRGICDKDGAPTKGE